MKRVLGLVVVLLLAFKVYAGEITVYNAADLVYAMEEIGKLYKQKYPQDNVKMIFGSSGKGYNQIVNGAPFDIVFSADMRYVEKLKQQGLTASEVKPYAIGRIVIWTRRDSGIDVSKGTNALFDNKVKKIAIANWEHAPYGVAAKECLEHYNLFDKVKDKLVFGENISQTAQYIQTGAADIGFLALSIAKSEKLQKEGNYYLLPATCHKEIKQGYAILKHATKDKETYETAKRFYDFIQTPEARKIFIKYGFVLPGEE